MGSVPRSETRKRRPAFASASINPAWVGAFRMELTHAFESFRRFMPRYDAGESIVATACVADTAEFEVDG